jgi:chitinase
VKDGTVTFLKALGLSASKIILGIAAYGRSFVLQDARVATINAPTTGNGFSGSFTKINGLLSYYEVNSFMNFLSK